jgi:adenylylsulfate kinase
LGEGDFIEVYVAADLSVCESRDPKGLYKKARAGQIAEFTGISAPYEAPEAPEITLRTDHDDVDTCARKVVSLLLQRGIIPG